MITPSPCHAGEGKRTISMTTLSPGAVFFAPGSPTQIVRGKGAAIDLDVALCFVFLIDADELMRVSLQNFDDHAALAWPLRADATAGKPNHYGVAAGCVAGFFTRDENIIGAIGWTLAIGWANEAIAARDSAEDAGDFAVVRGGRFLLCRDWRFFTARDGLGFATSLGGSRPLVGLIRYVGFALGHLDFKTLNVGRRSGSWFGALRFGFVLGIGLGRHDQMPWAPAEGV